MMEPFLGFAEVKDEPTDDQVSSTTQQPSVVDRVSDHSEDALSQCDKIIIKEEDVCIKDEPIEDLDAFTRCTTFAPAVKSKPISNRAKKDPTGHTGPSVAVKWEQPSGRVDSEDPVLGSLDVSEVDQVRSKFNNLRTYFLKEYHKICGTASGSARGYVMKWELFEVMPFLKDTLNNYTTESTENFTNEDCVQLPGNCVTIIHKDGTQESCIISPDSSAFPSPASQTPPEGSQSNTPSPPGSTPPLPSSSPSPQGSTLTLPSPLPQGSIPPLPSPSQSPNISAAKGPRGKKRKYNEEIEQECMSAVRELRDSCLQQQRGDLSFDFGKTVGHWMHGLTSMAQRVVTTRIMDVLNNIEPHFYKSQ